MCKFSCKICNFLKYWLINFGDKGVIFMCVFLWKTFSLFAWTSVRLRGIKASYNENLFQLISWMCLNQRCGLGGFQRVLQEYLVGATFALTRRSLPTSALPLMKMLPFTQHLKFADVKVRVNP